jgi:glycosyltransferase involved in cell wall biosynthesis
LFVGRVDIDKGTGIAVQIALKLGLPLKIAGKIDTKNMAYFDSEVKPYLNGQNIEYVGEVNFAENVKLYNEAIAVLYPLQFDEPFGLVMAESLASGTPVAALDRGSVREILSDDTAIICKTPEELIKRFPEISNISAETCRRRAEMLFSKERMVDDYEHVYARVVELAKLKSASSLSLQSLP